MNEKIIKPTRLQGTRWVPHMSKAAAALARCYKVIYTHFDHVSQAGPGQATAEVRGRATNLARKLRDFKVLRFLHYLLDLLEILARLSLNLQKIDVSTMDFLDYFETCSLELEILRQQSGEHLEAFLNEVQVDSDEVSYQDVQLTGYVRDMDYADLQDVTANVSARIQGRLEDANDASRLIFTNARVLDTRTWPGSREDLAVFGNREIQVLADHFGEPLQRIGCQVDELPRIAVKAHVGNMILNQPRPRPEEMTKLSSLYLVPENRRRFQNFLLLMDIALSLPVSASTCERGFSAVKRVKSDWRCNLTTNMLNHILMITLEGSSLDDFVPDPAIQRWWHRRRRPNFGNPQPNNPDQDQAQEDELLQYLMAQGMRLYRRIETCHHQINRRLRVTVFAYHTTPVALYH